MKKIEALLPYLVGVISPMLKAYDFYFHFFKEKAWEQKKMTAEENRKIYINKHFAKHLQNSSFI